MAEELDPKEDEPLIKISNLVKALNLVANEVVRIAANEEAPIGWSGELRAGIFAGKVKVSGNEISVSVNSFAESPDGFNYAEIQHSEGPFRNKRLRHITEAPFESSFSDLAPAGAAGGAEGRYQAGYREARKRKKHTKPIFNKYLNNAADRVFDEGLADKIFKAVL
jgi:hypothetical protein